MTRYDNTNRGVMFVNDRKQDGDRKPDRTGTLNVDGVEYFIDGWIKKAQNGTSFLSLSVKRKDKQPGGNHERPGQHSRTAAPQHTSRDDYSDDSDVPF